VPVSQVDEEQLLVPVADFCLLLQVTQILREAEIWG
jgi:hypothetical protein